MRRGVANPRFELDPIIFSRSFVSLRYHRSRKVPLLLLPQDDNTVILTMEVASPLSFGPNNAGTKRHLPCSPGFVDANRPHFAMDSSDEFVQHRSFKRRRFNMDVSMDGDSENSVNQASFPMHHTQQQKTTLFASANGEFRHCCPSFSIVELRSVTFLCRFYVVLLSEHYANERSSRHNRVTPSAR